jgi:hypothetical protein
MTMAMAVGIATGVGCDISQWPYIQPYITVIYGLVSQPIPVAISTAVAIYSAMAIYSVIYGLTKF